LVGSTSVKAFVRDVWAKAFLHIPGPPSKFADLMPWESLNSILTDQTFPESKLLLWRNKQRLPIPTFKHRVQMLRTPQLLDELNQGATLVLNAAQTCFGPLRDLTENLEVELRSETFANLYASWKSEPGFGMHRDKQHTMILQVHGRKHWKVYPPTPEEPSSSARPLWSGVLESGHLLHIPKGYWHLVVSVDEPSLHLTVTVMPTEPGELGQWLATQAVDATGWKPGADVPVIGSAREQARWVRHLRKQLVKACTDDVIERFLAERSAITMPRPQLRLPILGPQKIELDTQIRLLSSRIHISSVSATRIALRCGDSTWEMSKRALPVFEFLLDAKSHTLREALAYGDALGLSDPVLSLIQDLAKHQVVAIEPAS
jgi:ribosomal protein L16 Arg81 hydroxylase